MGELGGIESINGVVESKETRPRGVGVVMVQGMADLKGPGNAIMAGVIGARAYAPNWSDGEGVDEKLLKLEAEINEVRSEGKAVVLVGVSAGAGLSLLYMLRHPEDSGVLRLISVGGVINPVPMTEDREDQRLWDGLFKGHRAFTEMVCELSERLKDQAVLERLKSSGVVKAFVSGRKKSDEIVPHVALAPDWAKPTFVNNGNHLVSIISALVREVRNTTEALNGASFE